MKVILMNFFGKHLFQHLFFIKKKNKLFTSLSKLISAKIKPNCVHFPQFLYYLNIFLKI